MQKHKALTEIHLYIYAPNCACSPRGRHMCLPWARGCSPRSPCCLPLSGTCSHILERSPLWIEGPAHPHFLDTFALVQETLQVTFKFRSVSTSDIRFKGGKSAIHNGTYAPRGSFSVLTVNGFQEDGRKRSLLALVLIPTLLKKHMAKQWLSFKLQVYFLVDKNYKRMSSKADPNIFKLPTIILVFTSKCQGRFTKKCF